METITQNNKNQIEIAKAQLSLWLKELNLENIEVSYVGETTYNGEDSIILEDTLHNQFALVLQGIYNDKYGKLLINKNVDYTSFKRVQYSQKITNINAFCFLIQNVKEEATIGAIKYIPIGNKNIPLTPNQIDNSFIGTNFRIISSIKNLNENFSKVDFFLVPDNESDENDTNFFGNLIVFHNKFHFLITGRKELLKNNPSLRLELGGIYITSSELEELKEGNILEITEIENLNVNVTKDSEVFTQGNLFYESGHIKLKITSTQKENKVRKFNLEDKKLLNKNFVKRFFYKYGFENSIII